MKIKTLIILIALVSLSIGPAVSEQPVNSVWEYGGQAITGGFADADIADLGNGTYRLYYSAEPETAGFEGQVYSAVSQDGIHWQQEEGMRLKWATFPSVLKLADGRYRMYFQNQGVIKSAVSSDGLSWREEQGIRIDTANPSGLTLDNVADPTVLKLGNTYLMVYRGTINQRYSQMVPNSHTSLFLWATSADGLTFKKEGIALDSRNEEFKGMLVGPELAEWEDGSFRLYFWSYRGIYHTTFQNERFLQESQFDYTTASGPSVLFPPDPPADPTLMKINSRWFLYYGQHTRGVYYAILEE